MENYYIERRLYVDEDSVSEADCLSRGGVIIVLAEPGAGKTELLKSFARQLGVKSQRASIFRYGINVVKSTAIVIDALDEVSRQDPSAVDQTIVKTLESEASTIVLASRSSEWGNERNRFIEDCFGVRPIIVRLSPFDQSEQKELFERIFPNEQFDIFLEEATRFGLVQVLGNPMFFKLFVEGYIQGGRIFQSKHQIFNDAVDRLASDDGKGGSRTKRPPNSQVVLAASEIFAKLLLSGITGVSTVERLDCGGYLYISGITQKENAAIAALDSRLFISTMNVDFHEPVHRIVAEYCAAQYIIQRINDPADRLSSRRILALIAPNSVVRDELRGLLGWLAALGNSALQETIIEIDPYAVLANGDPAQLRAKSKKLLLRSLRKLSELDPYFRRSDAWRKFNIVGFFTDDVIEDVKNILGDQGNGSHLPQLILELLLDAEAIETLIADLRKFMLNASNDFNCRLLAYQCLSRFSDYSAIDDFLCLLDEGNHDALTIAANFISLSSLHPIERSLVLQLLNQLAALNPPMSASRPARRNDLRYLVRQLVSSISFDDTIWLLDNLTVSLKCRCNVEPRLDCLCFANISKIVAQLLDHYFNIVQGEHDPKKVWGWSKKLKFEREGFSESHAVKALHNDDHLRQSIHILAFENITQSAQIWEMISHLHWGQPHEGLRFKHKDVEAIVDYGFDTDNLKLWGGFVSPHNRYAKEKKPDTLRSKMRAQARDKPEFMQLWCRLDRSWRSAQRPRSHLQRNRRLQLRNQEIRDFNRAYLKANRARIEQGNDWWWNQKFAQTYLYFPENLRTIVDDAITAEKALANYLTSLLTPPPTLSELAKGHGQGVAMVLHAGCLIHFRINQSLANVDERVLRAVKTDLGGARCYRDGEAEALEAEVDAHIFRCEKDIEDFAREFIEPALWNLPGEPNNLWWLENKAAFKSLRVKLGLEWIERYNAMPLEATGRLFDVCAKECSRSQLTALIENQYKELVRASIELESYISTERKEFWALRHLFFSDNDKCDLWRYALIHPDSIFAIEQRVSRFGHEVETGWPELNADKIFLIVDAYVPFWPKVDLPTSWGSESPKIERAYRFIREVIWRIEKDDPSRSIPVINRMLLDCKFSDFYNDLRSMKMAAIRKNGLRDFKPPTSKEIISVLDGGGVASVEDMRALLIEELELLQAWLKGAETDPLDVFWPQGVRVDENIARNRVVEMLQVRMTALNASVVIEHHMAASNRCDFTAAKVIDGTTHLLVCEVKGQWHPKLFSAASNQLNDLYAAHPSAGSQGIYLVLWFGTEVKVAGKKNHGFMTPKDLRDEILTRMPAELNGLIDVCVLDLSKAIPF
ncbi:MULTISPECIES: hypothetical protein [unclassified Pseudomonas]|uniref:hypothetical protein n=1 Tax=unclassified Pseudomonas TaxID=196821 RepID=UPI000F566BA9|nr:MULTISPECIES: hypothetical protein [unclassified Pseudomonas]AZF48092.1 putative membrane protein [Pseudomonas sp. R2-7-07]AZF58597.1 putative membrane protein [Pseudomonas sp. R11-23-07]